MQGGIRLGESNCMLSVRCVLVALIRDDGGTIEASSRGHVSVQRGSIRKVRSGMGQRRRARMCRTESTRIWGASMRTRVRCLGPAFGSSMHELVSIRGERARDVSFGVLTLRHCMNSISQSRRCVTPAVSAEQIMVCGINFQTGDTYSGPFRRLILGLLEEIRSLPGAWCTSRNRFCFVWARPPFRGDFARARTHTHGPSCAAPVKDSFRG